MMISTFWLKCSHHSIHVNCPQRLLLFLRYISAVFRDRRLVIAVTQFDKQYTPEDDKLSLQTIREVVCSSVRAAVGKCIPEDMVVPVSGLWAWIARRLMCNPTNEKERQKAIECLQSYDEEPRGQDDRENIERSQSLVIASNLEKASRIRVLEDR